MGFSVAFRITRGLKRQIVDQAARNDSAKHMANHQSGCCICLDPEGITAAAGCKTSHLSYNQEAATGVANSRAHCLCQSLQKGHPTCCFFAYESVPNQTPVSTSGG